MGRLKVKRQMKVTVSGRAAVVVFPSFNKLCVQYEDGTQQMVSYQSIKIQDDVKQNDR